MARSPEKEKQRRAAIAKCKSENRRIKWMGNFGTNEQHALYLSGVSYDEAYPNDPNTVDVNTATSVDPETKIQQGCAEIGIEYKYVTPSAKPFRTPVIGKDPRNTSGGIRKFQDDKGAILFNNVDGTQLVVWFNDAPATMTAADKAERAARVARAEKELKEAQQQCKEESLNHWDNVAREEIPAVHPYLQGIKPYAAKYQSSGDLLVIPVTDIDGVLHGLQFISGNGSKKFKTSTVKAGHFCLIPGGEKMIICEGWKTGCSIREATGATVVVAFDAGNLLSVTTVIRGKYPHADITVAADNDIDTEGNPGVTKATAAAKQNGAKLAPVMFYPDQIATYRASHNNKPPTDYNDLHQLAGLDAVRLQIDVAALLPDSGDLDQATTGAVTCESPDLITDLRIKYYFSAKYKHLVQYVPGIGWHQWDGKRWCTDMPGGLHPLIDAMQRELMAESTAITNEKERIDRRKALIGLESHFRQVTVIEALKTVIDLNTSAELLDRDSMLLNCQNGTINLETGAFKTHDPADKITRIINTVYDPTACCPHFIRFITWAMCNDLTLVSYLKRFIGYCLTGKTSEQILNFWYGSGGNGKSTLMNVMQLLLCDYASTADTGLIMKRDTGSDGNRLSMLAGLRGSRFVTLSEVNDGEKLDEAAIKSYTGGDSITCRHLYQGFFTYTPQSKLVGFGNYKPHVRGTDHGIWRRIHLVPFKAVISEDAKDPNLPAILRAELPGILTWAVKGCLEWQRIGLKPPVAILNAVQEYRQTEDVFQSWLNECCVVDPSARTSAAALICSFKDYSGWRNTSDKKFGELLKERGLHKVRSNGIFWQGVSLDLERLERLTVFPESLKKNSIGSYGKMPSIVPIVPNYTEPELIPDFNF